MNHPDPANDPPTANVRLRPPLTPTPHIPQPLNPSNARAFSAVWENEIARVMLASTQSDEDWERLRERRAQAERARRWVSEEEVAAAGIMGGGVEEERMRRKGMVEGWGDGDGEGEGSLINVEVHDEMDVDAMDVDMDTDQCDQKVKGKGKENATDENTRDWFVRMSSAPELLMELAKYMDMPSLLTLYSMSQPFNNILNGHLSHALRACAAAQAPESSRVFPFTLYESLCMPDPVGRPHPIRKEEVRKVPSLRWLQMVVHREKSVRDILACLARQGHRTPAGMSLTLKKMWLVMDISTSARRAQVMHSRSYFTNMDLYNIQLFVVKLDMRFNDPIDGPADDHLRKLMLGQKGLTPLRRMLRRERFTKEVDVIKAAIRYDWAPPEEYAHLSLFGIGYDEVGTGHLEGWGKGNAHLDRPDELVVMESVKRGLRLKNHIIGMMLWGYVDPVTGLDTPPTDDEKYMSDEGEKPEHPLKQDYDWFEIEPPVYEESEQLKESNNPRYAIQKQREREKSKDEEKRMRNFERRMAGGLKRRRGRVATLAKTMVVDIPNAGESSTATLPIIVTTRLDDPREGAQERGHAAATENAGTRPEPGSRPNLPARPQPPLPPLKPRSRAAVEIAAVSMAHRMSPANAFRPAAPIQAVQNTNALGRGQPIIPQPAAPTQAVQNINTLGRGQPMQVPAAQQAGIHGMGRAQNTAAPTGQQFGPSAASQANTQNSHTLGSGRSQSLPGPTNASHMGTHGLVRSQGTATPAAQHFSSPATPASGRGQPAHGAGSASNQHMSALGSGRSQPSALPTGQQASLSFTLQPVVQSMSTLGLGSSQPSQYPSFFQQIDDLATSTSPALRPATAQSPTTQRGAQHMQAFGMAAAQHGAATSQGAVPQTTRPHPRAASPGLQNPNPLGLGRGQITAPQTTPINSTTQSINAVGRRRAVAFGSGSSAPSTWMGGRNRNGRGRRRENPAFPQDTSPGSANAQPLTNQQSHDPTRAQSMHTLRSDPGSAFGLHPAATAQGPAAAGFFPPPQQQLLPQPTTFSGTVHLGAQHNPAMRIGPGAQTFGAQQRAPTEPQLTQQQATTQQQQFPAPQAAAIPQQAIPRLGALFAPYTTEIEVAMSGVMTWVLDGETGARRIN
ncbi:uncharacterized protein L3040_002840 [Drepanopeziza brunnea f. sp. 'multigermtubi']|uniref:Uncharacterized protein n=1 Tax=Marssonina brunnea f. sp. multigermtubi (strain MB_m1) TaxID=1072389 RepID=K1WQW0_MARBU|nr:uncharacterized protein MBM_06943 [Drepanopeziza brunnea f. sp. 'multigermtubi' MB_m1]EKD14732.1 hypothetical protein MBM_06943 [Drepanopeziza brunnea f. sp. 'multigermtubi' MB_m1]KAJ5050973.1 hypothetical protein L3040_002840 [Drepanopeziza brunnea f. sp. 'multigermtubi']